jgi:hypothetical protein
MHHARRVGTLANGCGYALDASSAHISYGEYSRQATFEHLRRTRKRPRRVSIGLNTHRQIPPGEDEALLVKRDAASQPVGVGGR